VLQARLHDPAEHRALPLATVGQLLVHEPQWFTSEVGSTQLEPQSMGVGAVQLAAQVYEAPTRRQSGIAPEHVVPQLPHEVGAERSASQPSDAVPLQSAHPASQWNPHAVPSHVAVAWAGCGHGVHALPQLATSALESHAAPQVWKPGLQTKPHTPPAQSALPLATAGHGVHMGPHADAESSGTHVLPQA
jgi:hypothetical protein